MQRTLEVWFRAEILSLAQIRILVGCQGLFVILRVGGSNVHIAESSILLQLRSTAGVNYAEAKPDDGAGMKLS